MGNLNNSNFEKGLELPEVGREKTKGDGGQTVDPETGGLSQSIEFAGGERNQEVMKAAPKSPPSQSSQQATQSQDSPQADLPKISVQSTGSSSNPQIADDIDLIEKEWVDKAKELVNKTKDDPRQQNIELNKIKADYVKKRFNKDLKLKNEG